MLLGGIIGVEREIARKPAGIRTTMLGAGASTLMILLGNILISSYESNIFRGAIRTDPLRIVEAIIVGISFIGAGTIIQRKQKDRVENLTTAASILFTAAIGIAVALDQFYVAAGLTVMVLIINFVLALAVNCVKRWYSRRSS
jgi:putative Mg2+ transporter-C (MgtC) family protein